MTAEEQARARGHRPEWDPPHALSSVKRWTCSVCGAAVLDHRGTIYGSAIDRDCEFPAEESANPLELDRVEVVNNNLLGLTGTALLVRDSETSDHYVISATGSEVLVFPATEEGEVTDWGEVVRGRGSSHEDAIVELEGHLAGTAP